MASRTRAALKIWELLDVTKEEAKLRITAMLSTHAPGTHIPGPLAAVLPPVTGSMLEFGGGETILGC